jgi:hypothetical protein
MAGAPSDPVGDAKRQRELLDLISEPDEAFYGDAWDRATGCVSPLCSAVKSLAPGRSRTNSFQIRLTTAEAFELRIFRADARSVGREGRTLSGHVVGH